jgi:hypothetical protein
MMDVAASLPSSLASQLSVRAAEDTRRSSPSTSLLRDVCLRPYVQVEIRLVSELCYIAPKPRSNSVIYQNTPMRIVVAASA